MNIGINFMREDYSMKKKAFSLISIVLLIILTACGGGKDTPTGKDQGAAKTDTSETSSAKEPLKIGAVFSVSGSSSSLGKPEMDTMKMLVDYANASGGFYGHKLELYAYDDKSDQNEAVLIAKKLIEQDKVSVIIGSSNSGNALATIPLVEKGKIPFFAVASSKSINNPVKKFVFKTVQGDDIAMLKTIDYLKKNNLKNVAWLNVDNSFGSSGLEEFNKQAPAAGIKAVVTDVFEATVNDAKPMLTRVKKANPDAIIIWGTTQEAAVVTKNVRELGIQVPIFESHGVANAQFIELTGDASEGVIFPADRMIVVEQVAKDNPQKKVLEEFKKLFEDKYGYTADTYGGHVWDAFWIIKEAVKTAGTDPVKLRDAIESGTKNFVATGGIYTFSGTDHNGLKADSLSMIQIKNKKWILLD
jgi:branched-chain amino acid transport system substrate-binding protein